LPFGGYGIDPDLTKIYHPGDLWPLTMTPKERLATTVLYGQALVRLARFLEAQGR
jgi:hypothetical protein